MTLDINLQLFGGGGSSSGLGGGGGVSPSEGGSSTKKFIIGLQRPDGKWDQRVFTGKDIKDAQRKARRFAKQEMYKGISEKYKEVK